MSKFFTVLVVSSAILIALLSYYAHTRMQQSRSKGQILRIHPENTPYETWLAKAKKEIPVFAGLVIDDVRTVALQPWPQMGEGINGLYLRFADYQITDGRILEIPPQGKTAAQRHMFEMAIYFLGGQGYTMIQQEGKQPQRVDWRQRSLFSIPLNVRYQHFNDSDEPVRLLAVTGFPFVMNAMNSEEFIFANSYEFSDRYNAGDDYLKKQIAAKNNTTITNFVLDALDYKLNKYDYRGEGNTHAAWSMSGNTILNLHVSEMPAKIYKKAHRHSSDAFILILSGEGHSLTWQEGEYDKRVRIDWHEGALFVPPIFGYHQHLNSGSEPARYLAINAPGIVENLGLRFVEQLEVDLPEVQAEWKKEIAK